MYEQKSFVDFLGHQVVFVNQLVHTLTRYRELLRGFSYCQFVSDHYHGLGILHVSSFSVK
jgi:hypothetical protein